MFDSVFDGARARFRGAARVLAALTLMTVFAPPALGDPAPATAAAPAPPPAASGSARAAGAPTADGVPAQPSIEDFLAEPQLALGSLSPSGRYLAYVKVVGDKQRVSIIDLKERKGREVFAPPSPDLSTARFTFAQRSGVSEIKWKGDDRLVITTFASGVAAANGIVLIFSEPTVFVVDRAGEAKAKQVLLVRPNSRKPGDRKDPASLAAQLVQDPNHILVFRNGDQNGALYKADLRDGSAELVEPGQPGVTEYQLDSTGTVVARTRHKNGFLRSWSVIEGRAPGQATWTKIAEIHSKDIRKFSDFELLGPAPNPGEVFVAVRPKSPAEGDTTAVRVFDFKTMSLGPPVWSHPKYDVVDIVQDPVSGALMGGCYWVEVYQCDFSDKTLAANTKGLSKFFDGERSLTIVSMSDESGLWLLNVSGPDEPGTYFLYDRKTARIDLVGSRYPRLPIDSLGKMQRVGWTSRDGAVLGGYLTLPPGKTPGSPPLIVMPHGGPEARDHFEFDLWAQFFATRGYAVFQPNFRGSDGFGRAFAEAGYHQWGARMQDDVTDGVKALIAQGKVDPTKMCIVGASYGGYAALYGGATQSDLYKCVISIAGVSDLPEMLNWERDTFGADSDHISYWTRAMGDPKTDRELLRAKSPAQLAATYAVPVLLVHGTADETVPIKQSRIMEKALKRAGKPVRLIEIADEGHRDWSKEGNTKLLTEMEGFLAKYLGAPRPSKPVAASPSAEKTGKH